MNDRHSRRQILAGTLIGAAGAGLAGCATADRASEIVPGQVRRIVTADNGSGESAVVYADAAANAVVLNDATITRLWETDDTPVALPFTEDRGASAGNAYREGFSGTSLYTADIPPGRIDGIPMHRQDSIDYIAVLSGEIDLVLETETVTMRAGDVLVQGGNMHTWQNRSDGYCRLLVVVLTGERHAGSPPEPVTG